MRVDIEHIRKRFKEVGYKLLSEEYINNRTKLEFVCDVGHQHSITWNCFQSGTRCGKCFIKRKHAQKFIEESFNKSGYKVLEEYVDSKSHMRTECPKGHTYTTTWNDFQQGCRCPFCSGRAPSMDTMIDKFEKNGFTVVSTKPSGCRSKVRVVCERGHIHNVSPGYLSKGIGCKLCLTESKRTPFDQVVKEFNESGFIVLSKEYVSAHTPLVVECKNGHTIRKRLISVREGKECYQCTRKSRSKVSQRWLDGLEIPPLQREITLSVGGDRIRVDAFSPETNTVYEFLGDYWHGNPSTKNLQEVNEISGRTFQELYSQTFQRFDKLRAAGFNIIYVWENDFKNGKMVSDA